jgi:HAD superfamily hydrolase (TIGR01509 family)
MNQVYESIVHAAIFDLDGTLLDTESISSRSMEMVLRDYTDDYHINWELKKAILGLRGSDWTQIVIDNKGINGKLLPKDFFNKWENQFHSLSPSIQKMKSALELVQHLKTKTIKLAIATSSSRESMVKKLEYHQDLYELMDLIVCGDDNELQRGKPYPDIYLLAANRLQVMPKNCLVFEDALIGVQAGHAANMIVIACPDERVFRDDDLSSLISYRKYSSVIVESLEDVDLNMWTFTAEM